MELSCFVAQIADKLIDDLKFSTCLPREIATRQLQERLTDRDAIRAILGQPVRAVSEA